MRRVLAAIALIVAMPAAGQQAMPLDCAANSPDRSLASDLLDAFLAGQGLLVEAPDTDARLNKAMADCAIAHNVPEAQIGGYIAGNIYYMIGIETGRRLTELGLNLAPYDALLAERARNPALDIAAYIDARPEEFAEPGAQAALRGGISEDLVIALAGSYIQAWTVVQQMGAQSAGS